jgi:hypothetical protein
MPGRQASILHPAEQGTTQMKRAVLYLRVSTLDQHPETQLHDLRQMASQRGLYIVHEYTERISGANPIRAWREMSSANFSIVLPLPMFLCFIGADIAQSWREITTKGTA